MTKHHPNSQIVINDGKTAKPHTPVAHDPMTARREVDIELKRLRNEREIMEMLYGSDE